MALVILIACRVVFFFVTKQIINTLQYLDRIFSSSFIFPFSFSTHRYFCSVQVRELETDPVFNSGRGSVLTEKGTVEMEASIMDGPKRRCGAVSGVTTVKNPISLARLVMEKSPHSYLAFDGAEEFARQQVPNSYYIHFVLSLLPKSEIPNIYSIW